MKDRDRTFPDIPDEKKWKNAKAICYVLKPFYDCMYYMNCNKHIQYLLS